MSWGKIVVLLLILGGVFAFWEYRKSVTRKQVICHLQETLAENDRQLIRAKEKMKQLRAEEEGLKKDIEQAKKEKELADKKVEQMTERLTRQNNDGDDEDSILSEIKEIEDRLAYLKCYSTCLKTRDGEWETYTTKNNREARRWKITREYCKKHGNDFTDVKFSYSQISKERSDLSRKLGTLKAKLAKVKKSGKSVKKATTGATTNAPVIKNVEDAQNYAYEVERKLTLAERKYEKWQRDVDDCSNQINSLNGECSSIVIKLRVKYNCELDVGNKYSGEDVK